MITVFQESENGQSNELLEQVYRMRHKLFVERLGWNEIRRPDGREIDQFDGPDAVHICCLRDDKLVGYSRLLPTTKPHLLDTIYPQLLNGKSAPFGPDIFEWTRCTVVPDKIEGPDAFSQVTRLLYLGLVEYCLRAGITALTVEYHPFLLARQLELGFIVKPLALPSKINGHAVVPVFAEITENTLMTMRKMFEIDHSVIEIVSNTLIDRDINISI